MNNIETIDGNSVYSLSIEKLSEYFNPFTNNVWVKLVSPITKEEVEAAIEAGDLQSPDVPVSMFMGFWDESTREQHISRIAWLVVNFSDEYPIEIDFGIPSMGVGSSFQDGYHRLAAAIYLKKNNIKVIASGAISEIEKFVD